VSVLKGGEPSRETRIRRDRHGRWFDGDVPIEKASIIRAFDRWIDVAPDGRHCLRNSVNWAYVSIEGPPLFVVDVELRPDRIDLILSDERTEALDPSTLEIDRDGFLFARARSGTMLAQFTSRASFRLEPILGEDAAGLYLVLGGEKIRPQQSGT
jgi:hypothetical protein